MTVPAPPRILVVDDSIVVREILTFILRQVPEIMGAIIDQAGNGAVALNKLRAARYDLVLSDIRMPYLDGLGLVRAIRNELADQVTPVILISTLGSTEDVRRGLEAGASAYLLKPLTPRDIVGALREFFDRRRNASVDPPTDEKSPRPKS
jgi:DNA-binding response OmpR family regulator